MARERIDSVQLIGRVGVDHPPATPRGRLRFTSPPRIDRRTPVAVSIPKAQDRGVPMLFHRARQSNPGHYD